MQNFSWKWLVIIEDDDDNSIFFDVETIKEVIIVRTFKLFDIHLLLLLLHMFSDQGYQTKVLFFCETEAVENQ